MTTKPEAAVLAETRHRQALSDIDTAAKAAASAAGRAMGLRRASLAKPGELSELGKRGAAASWAKLGTGRERAIELKRRAMTRKRNARAKRAAMLAALRAQAAK